MDIFAHMLWTNVVYRKKYIDDKKNRLWAVFFGVVPDFISFVPVFLFFILYKITSNPTIGHIRDWLLNNYSSQSYNYTHSLVIFLTAVVIVLIVRKGKVYWPMFGWALHILIDIPSHKGFYETPFLYPLSNFKNHYAVPWSNPYFMIVNYCLLVVAYALIFYFYKINNAKKE